MMTCVHVGSWLHGCVVFQLIHAGTPLVRTITKVAKLPCKTALEGFVHRLVERVKCPGIIFVSVK
jgi:hypothetical protein